MYFITCDEPAEKRHGKLKGAEREVLCFVQIEKVR
jgi:hypothetical protein